jgi:phosphomannomutase
LNNKGLFLGPADVKKLFELADADNFNYPDYRNMGKYEFMKDADGVHVDGTLKIPFVDVEAIKAKHFKVAVDAVNGAGSYIVPRLLEQLGCDVVRVHCEPDGTFPRGAEPIPENLGDLRKAVKDNGCAVGFAVDPDADRCALVDGLGQSIGEEYTLAIATEEVLSQKKGGVCVNLSTSRMNQDVAEKYGCEFSRAKVGEINVSLQMIEKGCVIGGEGNGGVILPALHYGRDSLVAAALVLSWMAHHDGGPEKFVAENPSYAMPKKKFELGNKSVAEILPKVKAEFAGWDMDERDGLWLGHEKSWVHVRASNTEPVIRVIAEAPSAEEAESLCSRVEKLI